MYRNLIVARNVDRASEIQYRVENSESFISCHIDLIENAETSVNGTLVDRTGAKTTSPFLKVSFPIMEEASILIWKERL